MSSHPAVAATATVLVGSVALFAALTAAVLRWNDADRLDVRLVAWVHDSAPVAVVEAMSVLTYLGSALVLGPLALGAGVTLAWRGRRRAGVFVVAAFLGSQLATQALKRAVERARPELDEPFVLLSTYAFPSGHAFGATATYGALALVAWSLGAARRHLAAAAAGCAVATVCASRVVLGVHFTLDVLAGVAGGTALVCALLLALGPIREAREQEAQGTGLDRQLERRLEQDRLAVDGGARDRHA